MLANIISNTPLWVWAILVFLVNRGMLASRERELVISRIAIIPLVMLGLSWQGMAHSFAAESNWQLIWLFALVPMALLMYRNFDAGSIHALPQSGTLRLRGSWQPMMLMLAIFLTKYCVGVSLAMDPELAQHSLFVCLVSGMYGLFNGVFIGRMIATYVVYRKQCQPDNALTAQ